jgi:hypothetical protein
MLLLPVLALFDCENVTRLQKAELPDEQSRLHGSPLAVSGDLPLEFAAIAFEYDE